MRYLMQLIKVSKLAKALGVTVRTLYNWKEQGKLEYVVQNKMNYVTQETYNNMLGIKHNDEAKVVVYCRVSSTSNKSNLTTQRERLLNYCNARGYQVYKVIEEIGSGINDKRPKFSKLLESGDFTKIVVEHKDRLTRFGFNYIDTLLKTVGKDIEVVNNVNTDEEDVIQDFVSIITLYCAKIYGKRRCKRKTEKLIKELQK
jgi:putative resolvase